MQRRRCAREEERPSESAGTKMVHHGESHQWGNGDLRPLRHQPSHPLSARARVARRCARCHRLLSLLRPPRPPLNQALSLLQPRRGAVWPAAPHPSWCCPQLECGGRAQRPEPRLMGSAWGELVCVNHQPLPLWRRLKMAQPFTKNVGCACSGVHGKQMSGTFVSLPMVRWDYRKGVRADRIGRERGAGG